MQEARLENWYALYRGGDIYTPPEMKALCVGGQVYGHPDFKEGESIVTSRVMHADGLEVITTNTKYKLGKVDKHYKDWYADKYGKPINEEKPFPPDED